ncbi:hypothetical protein ACQB6R_05630 [Propionibacteriaceae bacterium G1746]
MAVRHTTSRRTLMAHRNSRGSARPACELTLQFDGRWDLYRADC